MRLIERLYEPVTAQAWIPAPPSAVYDVLADPETYPDWLMGADHMRGVDEEFPKPGSRFQHSVGPGGPLTVDDETESLEADVDHHLALLVHVGLFHARVDFDLRRDTDGGTTVSFSERPVGLAAPLLPFLRPVLKGRNAASLVKLRELVTGPGST